MDTVPAVVVAVPVSMTMLPLAPALALPVEIVVLLEVVPALEVTVAPPAPCKVRRPAFVPQVAAAALVRVRAPVLVVKLLAAFDVMLTAPAVALPMVVVAVPVVLMEVVPKTETVLPVRPRVPVVLPTLVLPVPVPRLVAAAPEVFMLVVPVTVVVPVMEVVPFVTVKFLPVATVVSPFRVTAPVPVLNVPLLADWSKLPVPAAKVMFWLAAILTFLFKFIWVALVVPMFRATAVAVSTSGVRTLVSALPVPEIQKLLLAC
jgi:hypothetical protein